MLPDSSKSFVSCCGYNMGMIKWTGNDLLTSKTTKKYILPKPYKEISHADWSRTMADKSTGRENDVVMVQFVFLFTHVVSQQVSTKMDVNNSQCNGKKKNFHGNVMSPPQNVQNFSMKPLTLSSWFHLSFVHFEITFMVDKGKDHEKLFSTWLNIKNIKMYSSNPGLSP